LIEARKLKHSVLAEIFESFERTVETELELSPYAVFDLIAWTRDHVGRIGTALGGAGSSLGAAKLIPAISADRRTAWTSLATASIWPDGRYSVLNAREVSRTVRDLRQ
jgi:hypothetical protein